MMSTDWSRSNGIFVDFLKIAPVSMRSSSSSMTNRVKYQANEAGDRSQQHDDAKDWQDPGQTAGLELILAGARDDLPTPADGDRDEDQPAADEGRQWMRSLGLLE